MTPRDLAHRRRILFTMLTVLTFRYPSGREPALIAGPPRLVLWLCNGSRPATKRAGAAGLMKPVTPGDVRVACAS